MDEYNKYAALADTIQIEKITSDRRKQIILQRLRDNDESFDKLWICSKDQVIDELDYYPYTSTELAWLGCFLGSSTTMKELYISSDLTHFDNSIRDVFLRGLANNKSIYQLNFECFAFAGQEMLRMVDQLMKNNNLTEINVTDCRVVAEGIRQFSLALGDCNKSLKSISFQSNTIEDGHLVPIITALSMHPQLTELCLSNMNMGRNECTALATLFRCTTSELQKLNLDRNSINDEGVELLVQALLKNNHLQYLNLLCNEDITITGWKAVATLLEMPCCNLKSLDVDYNNIGNEGALVFANALANNSTLETLEIRRNSITVEGWAHFSKLLCDTSSVNNTYMSNHTLKEIHPTNDARVNKYLVLNEREDKQQVAMSKILQHHSHFDMEPFFEWEFKVLPIIIEWFTNATRRVTTYDQKISRLRLSATFDFIKEFPMLYVEPMTRQEIAGYTAMEEARSALLGNQAESAQLEEIRRCKARAMRRL